MKEEASRKKNRAKLVLKVERTQILRGARETKPGQTSLLRGLEKLDLIFENLKIP